ncbi:sodium channel modifier 1-like [Mizuhopecten yessoensis]|uniref:Sodium channel modifier 1 n=1 Tax=Mizuhopecten yessoensis TaxID=6573 RepID=A0A210Q4T2_MIZYE|nr:sodium channel modifier 1-like [Mizuhopecten yessoensis]XP_021367221.1 sodium channel modifier 1-like [Mizuhopecten yessoensis]XP_021367222.1 sodium channel modifier 1-like [Mizuhopecten yessoensis]XP_021367223.1 sodium channel modifier 1-like [Mizuhopecten yessoensis]OWF43725.1 Sodium channel modifier 1 [Mizuhopecten yessoensis]
MSFKRDGNDSNQLGILRKRRVCELLGIAVPDDEALLMSNGRFACLVCGHRPVFDTVDMLILHRQGKKHLANADYEAEKKEELEKLIEKRKHDQYLKDGTTVIHQKKTSWRGLGLGVAYDPRAKKPRPHERKQKLDFTSSDSQETVTTNSLALPGNRSSLSYQNRNNLSNEIDSRKRAYYPKDHDYKLDKKSGAMSNQSFRDLLLQQQADNGPVKHSKQLKNIFGEKSTDEKSIEEYKPYIGHRIQRNLCDSELPVDSACTSALQSSCSRQNFMGSRFHSNEQSSSTFDGQSAILGHTSSRGDNFSKLEHSDILSLAENPPPPPNNRKQLKKKLSCRPEASAVSDERKRKAELYLQCRGAGWKKDLTGKWIRDEEAEFDSDEEPPDLP